MLVLVGLAACSFDNSGTSANRGGLDDTEEPGGDDDEGTVEPEEGTGEAPAITTCDSNNCPGACVDGACVIYCNKRDSCPKEITCPPGVPCKVRCIGEDSCKGGVTCGDASHCDVLCGGVDSCEGAVTCGEQSCNVGCVGPGSCDTSVDCADSCACSVACSVGTCGDPVMPPACRAGCEAVAPLVGCLGTSGGGTCDVCELPDDTNDSQDN